VGTSLQFSKHACLQTFCETDARRRIAPAFARRGGSATPYLFAGDQLEELESLARTLAKTLNCQNPVKAGGWTTDCCDVCLSCRKLTTIPC